MSSSKPLVLVVGITGRTGQSITKALITAGTFRVAAIIRPESRSKPLVSQFEAAGVELKEGNVTQDSVEKLTSLLTGADIAISAVSVAFTDQTNLIYAAKAANVKRFVPSEFGLDLPRGVTWSVDDHLDKRELIKKLEIPYTIIPTGWWTHALFPYSHKLERSLFEKLVSTFFGKGDRKVACTALKNIGAFVVRIIGDPRTLNKIVMTYDGEWTQGEAWRLAEEITGEDFSDYPKLNAVQIEEGLKGDRLTSLWFTFGKNMHIEGRCTAARAIGIHGALDARKLYPDYTPSSLEEIGREFYENPLRNLGTVPPPTELETLNL